MPYLTKKADTLEGEYLGNDSGGMNIAASAALGGAAVLGGATATGVFMGNPPTPSIDILKQTIANAKGADIHFAEGIDEKPVSSYTKNILSQVGKELGVNNLTVTSANRTLDQQMAAMYNNEENGNKIKYGPIGKAVLKAYDSAKNENKTKDEIISEMKKTAEEKLKNPRNILSRHIGPDYNDWNAVDISKKQLNKEEFTKAVAKVNKNLPKDMKIKLIPEEYCFHLEIPQSKYTNINARDLANLQTNKI